MTLPRLGAPLTVGLAGVLLLYLMARFDGAQSERLHELDRQDQQATTQTLEAARTWKATKAASVAAKAEIARRRAVEAALARQNEALRRRADSLTVTIQPILAGLPDTVAAPIRLALIAKDSVITTQTSESGKLVGDCG